MCAQEERRSSSPCTEILHCWALVECELFSKRIEVIIKIQVELRNKGLDSGREKLYGQKRAMLQNTVWGIWVALISVSCLYSTCSLPSLHALSFPSWPHFSFGSWFYFLPFSPIGFSCETWGQKERRGGGIAFQCLSQWVRGVFLWSLQELMHLCKLKFYVKLEVVLASFECTQYKCLVCTLLLE